jgi:nicotinamidase-related amidase
MPMASGIRFGPIAASAVHLCIDMQRLFAGESPWAAPWMSRVLPQVARVCEHRTERTCFTRFVPPRTPSDASGAWQRYWARWPEMTLSALKPDLVRLVPPLEDFTPPAKILDKATYSPWVGTGLAQSLAGAKVDTVVITGAETDMCVLATVLGAVDLGMRVIVVADAVCSSSDAAHDALIALYHERYSQQIEIAPCDEVLDAWSAR